MGTFATYTSFATLVPDWTFGAAMNTLGGFCVNWAESQVKARLARRYNVGNAPFTVFTTTSMLTNITEELALGYLFKLSSRGAKQQIDRGNALMESALAQIKDLADHRMDLLDASLGTSVIADRSDSQVIFASMAAYHPTFDEDDPLNWGTDDDKINDIATERL